MQAKISSQSRLLGTSLPPAVVVLSTCIRNLFLFCFPKPPLNAFHPLLSIEEAEELNSDGSLPTRKQPSKTEAKAPLWFTFLLSMIAIAETVVWTSYLIGFSTSDTEPYTIASTALMSASWLFATFMPSLIRKVTPPYELLLLYISFLVSEVINFGDFLVDRIFVTPPTPLSQGVLGIHIANLTAILLLLLAVLSRPIAPPYSQDTACRAPTAPEDHASLWSWLTYEWLSPLIKQGTYKDLSDDDIPMLSITSQAKPLFLKFNTFKQKSLPWQLFKANSLDIILNFLGSVLSVVLNYAGPFYLKKIIQSMENMTPENRASAYISALLMFASQVLKATVDGQHLYFGRRAATRVRSELMSAIYEKALKRRDFSGVVVQGKDGSKNAGGPGEKGKNGKKGKGKGKDDEEPGPGADIGKIVSLMSSDASMIANLVSGANTIYGAPFEIIIACVFLYQLLGWSAFVGFAVLCIGWPLNTVLSRRATRITKNTLSARDKRLSVLNELVSAVKPIKFFAWEDRWIQRVLDAREVEIGWIRKLRINSVMLQALWTTAPILVSIVSFFVYVMRGNDLDVATAFTAITLFTMIKQPLNTIPTWVVQLLRTRVSVRRIETFLNEDEVTEQVSSIKRPLTGPQTFSDGALGFRNASFKWNEIVETGKVPGKVVGSDVPSGAVDLATPVRKFELQNLDIVFPEEKLTLVTGPTASGKSALILALLGEMTLLPGGEIHLPKKPGVADEHGLTRSISYAAQTPWLQHLTIKENILFGSPFDEERYKEVIECCALLPDLEILEDGDETEIGARGINLSGGQKARVALARAAYARTKYVLLDDPLSAVDSPTARHLYERLLCGSLMEHRTVLLVTHHVDLILPRAYYIVRMDNGRIGLHGEVASLISTGDIVPASTSGSEAVERQSSANLDKFNAPQQAADPVPKDLKGKGKKPAKLVQPEVRETGRIKWPVYKRYLKASSYKIWVILLILTSLNQGMGFLEKFWMKIWGEAYGADSSSGIHLVSSYDPLFSSDQLPFRMHGSAETRIDSQGLQSSLPSANTHPIFYVGIYALIGLMTVVFTVFSASMQFLGSIRASRQLFMELLHSIVHATMRWHDTTPIGRILNRFSKDFEIIDASLASSFRSFYTAAASFITSMIIVIGVFPPFIFPAAVIGYLYYRVAIGYLNTSRQLRRMESTTRSPIFSGFGELLDGIVTVRAFSAERRFLYNLHSKVDLTMKMFFYFWMTNRWLLFNFDCLGAFAVLNTTIFALALHSNESEHWAGWAALCISSAMSFTSRFYWACRYWTRLELDLNAVERIIEYLDIPQEPPSVVEDNRPPAYWPSASGACGPYHDSFLVVRGLEVQYAPGLPSVLYDISFTAKAGERIGIVGRTGSGKSTLATSILRFVEPVNGNIIIDGIDTASIGIRDLRSRVTFIPQDATLFSGSIKDNVDPFGDYSESECLDALRRVHLISDESDEVLNETADTPGSSLDSSSLVSGITLVGSTKSVAKITLDTEVSAGGTNFSAGQRQLIALARASLRQSAIVILDEATSSIDFETDNKIQATIREEFRTSLLLTIAHRLRTVIDYDRLLVLDAGRIVEFDTPRALIQNTDGIFREMCSRSGSFSELEQLAKAKYTA